MINKELLKEIIVSNEEFILNQVKGIIKREGIIFPDFPDFLDVPGNKRLNLNKVVILYGVRRSGKTYILYDLFKKYKDRALYIDFEDERLADFETKDFERLKEAFLELKPRLAGANGGEAKEKEMIFLFDEIQNIKGWERFCRRITERENIKVFVSGSSSRMIPLEIHTSLRERAWSIEVTPFSFWEYLPLKGMDIKDKNIIYGSKKALVKKHFSEYLKWVGIPGLQKSDIGEQAF